MQTTLNLFCLPFAGGNKYSYRQFEERTPFFLTITTLEYPGRGKRTKEPLNSDIYELVDDLYTQVRDKVDTMAYAIYGHSMGGLTAFLLARKLTENNHRPPLHLFISGTTGPSAFSRGEEKRHLLGKNEFMETIRAFDGIPSEILQNPELLHYFEPILRSDFMASENYVYKKASPMNIPITVITGTREDLEEKDVLLWQKETTRKVDFRQMPGRHFFIFKYTTEVIEIITRKLTVYTNEFQHE